VRGLHRRTATAHPDIKNAKIDLSRTYTAEFAKKATG
jgi:hypothetical protein